MFLKVSYAFQSFPKHPGINKPYLIIVFLLKVSYIFQSFPKHPRINKPYFSIVFLVIFNVVKWFLMLSNTNTNKSNQNRRKLNKINRNQTKSIESKQNQSKPLKNKPLYGGSCGPSVAWHTSGYTFGYTSGILLGILFRATPRLKAWCKHHDPNKSNNCCHFQCFKVSYIFQFFPKHPRINNPCCFITVLVIFQCS